MKLSAPLTPRKTKVLSRKPKSCAVFSSLDIKITSLNDDNNGDTADNNNGDILQIDESVAAEDDDISNNIMTLSNDDNEQE